MIDKGIEDADAASWKGFKHWDELYQKALRLEEKEKRGYTEPDEEQQRAISRKNYYRAMYMLAYQRVYPPAVGEHRRPSGGAMIVLEGGRKPASYEILTNTGDVIRQLQKRRSRRYSNPRCTSPQPLGMPRPVGWPLFSSCSSLSLPLSLSFSLHSPVRPSSPLA